MVDMIGLEIGLIYFSYKYIKQRIKLKYDSFIISYHLIMCTKRVVN